MLSFAEIDKILNKILNSDPPVANLLKNADYILGKKLTFEEIEKIQIEAIKIQLIYKLYILGVVQNDKEMRVAALKKLKLFYEEILPSLKSFKSYWKDKEAAKKTCTHCE